MFRIAIFALGVGAAAAVPAAADPEPCGVEVKRAPGELGSLIERRLAAMGACDGQLDVWIVTAEGGLYVIARDELGRVRERVVPDAEVAIALIASWVEVDAAMPLTGAGLIVAAPVRTAAVQAFDDPPPAEPPRPPVTEVYPVDQPGGDPEPRRPSTLGMTAFAGITQGGMTIGGAMIDHDVLAHGGIAMALTAVVSREISSSYYVVSWDDDFFRETGRWGGALLLELRRRFGTGRWRVTPKVAFGFGATYHEILTAPEAPPGEIAMTEIVGETTLGPRIAASVALGLRIADSLDLELTAGWMFTAYQTGGRGVDPSDQALIGGLGLRYGR